MADKTKTQAAPAAASQEEETKKETPKPKLPAGLTQEMVDSFKAAYPKVSLARVAGIYVVTRPVSREEFVAAREAAKSEQGFNEALAAAGMLWAEDKPATASAGFRQGVLTTIADMSEVRESPLFFADEDLLTRWPEIMKNYKPEQQLDLKSFMEKYEILWVMLTEDTVYLMTYVNKADYDNAVEKATDMLDDRMIMHGLVTPKLYSADLRRLPYGRYNAIYSNLMITTGFNPEPAVLL